MTTNAGIWDERIEWLRRAVGPVTLSPDPRSRKLGTLIAVTCSRLGHDTALHRHVCQFLCRSLMECRRRDASLLVATGSAIEAWALRAAELLAVPVVRVTVDSAGAAGDICIRSTDATPLSRDAVVIALADRVDGVFVRRGGAIERYLQARIECRCDASTRVAVSAVGKCAANELIAAGAVGWFHPRAGSDSLVEDSSATTDSRLNLEGSPDAWTRTEGRWLIHCTRRRDGPWPGETERQYRDSILLGGESSALREPIDALVRIIGTGRLVATATASMKRYPVVCFSALSLRELLQRRCFRPQLGRWDYEPYGIAIRLSTAKRLGIEPVIYGHPAERSRLPREDQYRFHPKGKTYDWREEREWRSSHSVDLLELDPDDIRVFAEDGDESRRRLQNARWPVTFVKAEP